MEAVRRRNGGALTVVAVRSDKAEPSASPVISDCGRSYAVQLPPLRMIAAGDGSCYVWYAVLAREGEYEQYYNELQEELAL